MGKVTAFLLMMPKRKKAAAKTIERMTMSLPNMEKASTTKGVKGIFTSLMSVVYWDCSCDIR